MADPDLVQVYCAANTQEAYLIKASLDDAGIDARVVGDHLQNAIGELPAFVIAPSVWVRGEDFDRARAILAEHETRDADATPKSRWKCPECGEINEPTFEVCWNCQAVPEDTE